MNPFIEMLRKITSSSYHDRVQRSMALLNECLGVNHFWYYRIIHSGHYAYIGSHLPWSEFCFNESMAQHFPLRHPSTLESGIYLLKATASSDLKKVFNVAWEKFHINFNINILQKVPEGVESFGFASRFNDSREEQRLLNELPLLRHFIKYFKKEHQKLLWVLEENQVDIATHFGSLFYEKSSVFVFPCNRDQFLRKMGLGAALTLTPQEKKTLKLASKGYPAPFIANQLRLSTRTAENYIASIKSKLSCKSKVSLIQKAQEIDALGYLD